MVSNDNRRKDSLLRVKMTQTLADTKLDDRSARLRLAAPRGVYNLSPWAYVLGLGGAVLAILFAIYAIDHERSRTQRLERALQPAATATASSSVDPAAGWRGRPLSGEEVWIEVQ